MSESNNPLNCYYRISVKALVLNETRDKFLIVQEDNGLWEIPGGGLDWGEDPHVGLQRELQEEMGLTANWIDEHPCYFLVGETQITREPRWASNVVYEATLDNLNFSPTDECVAINWVGLDNMNEFEYYPNVPLLLKQFDPKRHQK